MTANHKQSQCKAECPMAQNISTLELDNCVPVCIGYMTVTLFFRIESQIWQVEGITVLHQTVVCQKEK